MTEIPARIDEVSKQLVTVDVGALEVEKAAKETALKKVEDKLAGGTEKSKEINAKREQVMNLKFDLSDISNKETEILMEKRRGVASECNEVEEKLMSLKRQANSIAVDIESAEKQKESAETDKKKFIDEWRREKSKRVPRNEDIPRIHAIAGTCRRRFDLSDLRSISSERSSRKAYF